MKVSTRSRYSIRIMTYLADHASADKPTSLREVSKRQRMSLRYAEQLIVPLKNAGLVRSVAGKSGGYYLAKKPKYLTINEIMEAASGPVRLLTCVKNKRSCEYYRDCSARKMWETINATIVKILTDFTLEDLSQSKMRLKGRSKIDKWLGVKC
ncbi:MAG: Rrf2 family transcriptional regulator [Elusimicrobiota bacterium]